MADTETLQGMRVAILVTDGFEQVEMTGPRDAMNAEGVQTQILSAKPGEVQGFNHHDRADKFNVDLRITDAKPDDFDAVLLPGGVINGDQMRVIPEAQRFVQQMDEQGKPIFVICHGGWLLVSAGLVNGRTMTSWPTLQDDIRNAGAQWVDREVVVDGRLVSSRKPADLPAFNKNIVDILHQVKSGAMSGKTGDQASRGARL